MGFLKQFCKKALGLGLAAALALSVAPVSAQASVSYDKSSVVYLTSTDGSSGISKSISVSCKKKSETIKKSSIKSSEKSVAELEYLSKYTNTNTTDYFTKDDSRNTESKYYSYNICMKLKKAGKSDISFKVGNKTYKSTVTVKKYDNPIQTLKITGVKKGKNIASTFQKSANASDSYKMSGKSNVVKITPKKGWKISSIAVHDSMSNDSLNLGNYSVDGLKNAQLEIGGITKGSSKNVTIACVNKSNGANLYCYLHLE